MLSRTADHLYWMSRYIERAESLARLVDAHYRMSLLPQSGEALAQSLAATMIARCTWTRPICERHDEHRAARGVRFVAFDRELQRQHRQLPARGARERPRGARLDHLRTVGDLEFHLARSAHASCCGAAQRADIGQFVEWVKERSHLTRGVTIGTMLRDEAFHFTRIGTFLERADNTARILTAHQSDLKPGADAGARAGPLSSGACCCARCRPSRSIGASTAT